jgi:murein DD-endopeptidase MepM/ murein hydrolase activator NlpD
MADDRSRLQKAAVKRARMLYRFGSTGMAEALFGSEDFNELSQRTEMLSQVSLGDAEVFVELSRSSAEMEQLSKELEIRQADLESTSEELQDEAGALREKLRDVSDEYRELQRKLAAAARARQQAAITPEPAVQPGGPAPAPLPPVVPKNGMVCPVNGPNSFIDSWGYPRSGGRSHEGTDVMADYGTPVVAITSGTITLSSYGPSAGNWIVLSGDDGNSYWYMHHQENLVNSGHVETGQQIATVGDTGNATGIPHLHFEYHPGGGGPVNPYPLIRPLC